MCASGSDLFAASTFLAISTSSSRGACARRPGNCSASSSWILRLVVPIRLAPVGMPLSRLGRSCPTRAARRRSGLLRRLQPWGDLEGPWPTVALLAWTAGLAGYAWSVFGARRYFPDFQPLCRRAALVYLGSVVGMLVVIRFGSLLMESQHPLGPALIVLAVALHFLPFAWAFRTPMFTTLGLLMAGLGVVGLGLGWF